MPFGKPVGKVVDSGREGDLRNDGQLTVPDDEMLSQPSELSVQLVGVGQHWERHGGRGSVDGVLHRGSGVGLPGVGRQMMCTNLKTHLVTVVIV